MSDFHRDFPELVGTDADPWMSNATYRRSLNFKGYPDACTNCGTHINWNAGLCDDCNKDQS